MASSAKSTGPYDVFLSFRGSDVRNSFVSHLYRALDWNGIHTFRDDEELGKGEGPSMLLKAIEKSRIAIIVFSENYTFSQWCLEEVAKIMECKEQKGLTVLPVFYKVDPKEVRGGRASYARGLAKHESKRGKDSEEMKRWKNALLDAGSLSGWTLNDGDESELVQEIVENISTYLARTPLQVAKHPVGIDSRVATLKSILSLESDYGVLMVGLWGQGGIGKTSLAKALYNAIFRQFQGSCFLANVREASKDSWGLVTLQEKLLKDILPRQELKVSNVHGGGPLIQHRLGRKKVLIILDDVDELRQLNALAGESNWFGNGSRIVITTRDKQLLTCHRIDQHHVYEVKALDGSEAHELLRKHAFQTHQIKIELVDSALNYAKGLPLALEVLGSSLCGVGEDVWESTLKKLSRNLDKTINDVLVVSFDRLDENEKEIFLHIACFFKGWEKEYIKKVLDSCNLETAVGFDILIKRSLIRIEGKFVQVHDLIQAMGMDIVNQECRDDPAKRSRLWSYDDVANVLSRDVGDCAVKSIVLKLPEPMEICISPDALTKMRRLRLLILHNVRYSFQGPNDLRWFEWLPCANQIPESLGPKKLVGLGMGGGNVTGVVKQSKSMEKMKDEAGQRPEDMETSDRNYAIAAVRNIVGIDGRVKQVTDLLEMEVNDEVRVLGIYGTDGIGKTTLAKAVYDRISSCFDSCSFLPEIVETTQNPWGIPFLQTKLIRDILERGHEDPSFDERIEDFLDIFGKRKVLIVVDDVEEQSDLREIVGDQLHWFGPGSRIIVTSKNEEILKEYDPKKARTYTVSALDDGQAFELFCKHAFRIRSSRPDYDGLANRIVNATEKLPLAVEVVGSFLRGKSIQEWAKMEESMNARATSSQKAMVGLEKTLDICYDELDQQQKDIFLDIACFIPGVDARIASYMWPNSYLPSSDCILMPLAKIGEHNELQMHRLLRCLGKKISKKEESQEPSSRRFCTQDMVVKAMNREKGMGNIEALCSDFTAGDFQSMPKIRFLKLDNARVSGNFAGAFASLRWLCWQRCPPEFDAKNLVLSELAILELPRAQITEDWRGWREIKMPKLKVLNLTGCSDLLFTPDFAGYKDLEILILEGCSCLVKLDPSIGHLKRLVSLNLKSCSRLNSLPVEMGGMAALKELFIDGTSVRQIPISIGNLKKLEILSGFQCFPLTQLPISICYLTALSELSFDGANITELPSSLGDQLKLRRLSLRNCRYLEELPDSIGNMGSSLEELDISATCISELPDSIRNLESLKVLRMDYSFVQAFPGEIGNLTKLEELHASWCRSLKGAVPRDIKRLHHLRSLTLGHSRISSLPSEISTLSSLHTLDLLQCNEIEALPQLPSSLIRLHVSSTRMKAIPILKDLKELEELCLSDENPKEHRPPSEQPMPESNRQHPLFKWFSRLWNLEFLQTKRIDKQSFLLSFPKLRKLELSLSQIIKLNFEPTDIPQLKTLTLSGLSLKEVSELPKTLSVFELYHSAIEEIEGLEGLEALRRLEISNCNIQNLNGIGQLTSLRSLILSDCDDLDSLPDLSNLQSLKILEIRRCKMIRQIEGIEKLTSLQKLNISECPAENSVQVQNALKHVMASSSLISVHGIHPVEG